MRINDEDPVVEDDDGGIGIENVCRPGQGDVDAGGSFLQVEELVVCRKRSRPPDERQHNTYTHEPPHDSLG